MRRRAFMAGLLAASAPTMAHGQEHARIAILHSGFPNRTPIHLLFEALGRLGYEHGRTATIDLHGGEGNPDRLSALVAQIATQKPHVVIAITAPAAVALKRPELSMPVVFAVVLDPVGLGLVESLAPPAGNFTGTTYSEADLGGKRLEFLIDALPETRRVAVLWGSGVQQNAPLLESIRNSASTRHRDLRARAPRPRRPRAGLRSRRAGRCASRRVPERQPDVRTSQTSCRACACPSPAIHARVPGRGGGRRLDVLRSEPRRELSACRGPRRPDP